MTLIHCFDFLSNAISAVVYYHNPENRPVNGICVANHTSPIDALVLMCDNCYSLVSTTFSPLHALNFDYFNFPFLHFSPSVFTAFKSAIGVIKTYFCSFYYSFFCLSCLCYVNTVACYQFVFNYFSSTNDSFNELLDWPKTRRLSWSASKSTSTSIAAHLV